MSDRRKFGEWVHSYRNGFGRRPGSNEAGPIVLRIADVSSGVIDLTEPRRGSVSQNEAATYKLEPGDLLFVRVNGARDIVGRCCVVGEDIPSDTIFNDHLIRVRLKPGLAPQFARLCVSLPAARAILEQAASTSAGQLTINQEILHSIEIPNVSLDDQRRIAAQLKAQLAAVEQARQAAQTQTREIDALRLAIYRESFVDIVPVAVPPAFEEAPENWSWVKLSEVARLESGHTPSRSRSDWWGGNVSWVSLTEIRSLDGRWVEETQIRTNEKGIANSAARILPRGTVCFSRTASVGFVTILGQPMATSQDFSNWVCGNDLDPEFLMYALIRSRNELRALATGATHKTIYMPTLEEFHLCLPNRKVQECIVEDLKSQLAAVEQARQGMQTQLEEIERLPARLLAQAFGEY